MRVDPRVEFDIYQHTAEQLQSARVAVAIVYMSYCDVCNATKPHVEALAREHGFPLVRINGDRFDPESAGTHFPCLSVYHDGIQTPSLRGARTKEQIVSYLRHYGAIQ